MMLKCCMNFFLEIIYQTSDIILYYISLNIKKYIFTLFLNDCNKYTTIDIFFMLRSFLSRIIMV